VTLPTDLTFLAPPGEAADWRTILLCDAAAATGLLDKLPGTSEELLGRTGLDPQAMRVVLDALVTMDVLETDADGRFALAATGPEPAAMAGVRSVHWVVSPAASRTRKLSCGVQKL